MNNKTKTALILASVLILTGLIVFLVFMSKLGWNFTQLSSIKYEVNTYKINEKYEDILIISSTADITFITSEDETGSVTCNEQKRLKYSVTVKDETLRIELDDTRKWYDYIGINYNTPKITVQMPAGEYGELTVKANTGDVDIPSNFSFKNADISLSTGDVTSYASISGELKIKTSTGDINIEDLAADSIKLSASTGKISATDVVCEGDIALDVTTGKTVLNVVSCRNLNSLGNTGDLYLNSVIAKEKLSIERSTGDVKFDGCDAAEIFVKTDTGSITGSLLSDKIFITQTDTGRITVPSTTSGGKCELTTDTGDVKITLK